MPNKPHLPKNVGIDIPCQIDGKSLCKFHVVELDAFVHILFSGYIQWWPNTEPAQHQAGAKCWRSCTFLQITEESLQNNGLPHNTSRKKQPLVVTGRRKCRKPAGNSGFDSLHAAGKKYKLLPWHPWQTSALATGFFCAMHHLNASFISVFVKLSLTEIIKETKSYMSCLWCFVFRPPSSPVCLSPSSPFHIYLAQ